MTQEKRYPNFKSAPYPDQPVYHLSGVVRYVRYSVGYDPDTDSWLTAVSINAGGRIPCDRWMIKWNSDNHRWERQEDKN